MYSSKPVCYFPGFLFFFGGASLAGFFFLFLVFLPETVAAVAVAEVVASRGGKDDSYWCSS